MKTCNYRSIPPTPIITAYTTPSVGFRHFRGVLYARDVHADDRQMNNLPTRRRALYVQRHATAGIDVITTTGRRTPTEASSVGETVW